MSTGAQGRLLLLVAACLVVAWLRTRSDQRAMGPRVRLREFAWCAALVTLALNVQSPFYWTLIHRDIFHRLVIPVLAAVLVAWRPRAARPLVAVGLILFGLCGFAVAGDAPFFTSGARYGLVTVGGGSMGFYLVLPEAYAFLALGVWIALRYGDERSARGRLLLGPLAEQAWPSRLRAVALLPVVMMLARLVCPSIWFGGGVDVGVRTVALLAGAALLTRRAPDTAARLATAGLLVLGLVGLWAAEQWVASAWRLLPSDGYLLYGGVAVTDRTLAFVAAGQAAAFISFGLWLAPQTFPQVRRLLGMTADSELLVRVQRLTESRAVAVDTASANLRRLERDLHDGAQARLVALGMNLRAAERLIPTSPEAAIELVAEARETSVKALRELRELVRGVVPPVLADRGLADAVRALALDSPLHVETDVELPGRVPAPVETACYFAVAELLTNAAKHSGARDARIAVSHSGRLLRIEVTDFGLGGADPASGSGLAGVEKRLASFDGVLAISSPVGGPTMVVIEVPCALPSPQSSHR